MKERDLIFFQPLWRRVAVTTFCFLWAVFEWMGDSPFWGIIALGVSGYCYWTLFHTFEPMSADKDEE